MKKLLLFTLLTYLTISSLAQNGINNSKNVVGGSLHAAYPGMCKSDRKHVEMMLSDSVYANYRIEKHQKMMDYLKLPSNQRSLSGVVTIPVVVHVIHKGEAVGVETNISDAQIYSAIDNLNDAYSNTGYSGLDIEIQFILAKRDENCNATTGINRVLGTGVTGYDADGITDANEVDVKALSKWSNNSYYNIWIVSEIDGNNAGGGTQGYAYFPGAGASKDGAVIMYNSFGYDPTGALNYELKPYTNYNVTTIHELGHGLDLYHTFQGDDLDGDGTADNCPGPADDGDFCSDTDPHQRNDSDCNAPVDLTCNGVANSAVHNNFMAYTSDACQNRFTANQKDRMRAALELERPGLVSSLGGVVPPAVAPNTMAAACEPQSSSSPSEGINGGYGGIMNVSFGTVNSSTSNTANDHIAYGTFGYLDYSQDCNSYAVFDIGETVNIDITTWFNNHVIDVFVDWNNNGVFDSGEEMVSLSTTGSNNGGDNNATGSFVVPANANTEEYLRIRFNADINAVNGACEAPKYGQVEDYAVYVNATACAEPDVPVLTHSGIICDGSTATINISGNLNDATQWHVYSNSCGGTQIGTTSGGTFVVTPSSPSSTYFIRGEGGCTSLASCGQITLNVTSLDDASFNFSAGNYCTNDSDPIPTITGLSGGDFSSTAGLSLNSSSGIIDVSTSSVGIYNVTYTTTGDCPNSSIEQVEIENCVVVPNANLRYKDRGKTLSTFSQLFYTTYVSGANQYEIQLTPQGGGSPTTVFTSTLRSMTLQQAGLLSLGVTYDVRVRAHVGSNVGNFSGTYQITAPTSVPNANLRTEDRGKTLSNFSELFYTSYVAGATQYDILLTPQGGGTPITAIASSNRSMTLLQAGITSFGVTYDVQVRAYIGGNMGNYTSTFQISSPAGVPNANLRAEDRGKTLSSFSEIFYTTYVAGASQYEIQFTPQGGGFPVNVITSNRAMTLQQASLLDPGITYDVQVRAYIGANMGNYAATYQITAPGVVQVMIINDGEVVEAVADFENNQSNAGLTSSIDAKNILEGISAYPNPFTQFIIINCGDNLDEKEVQVYNAVGQIVKTEVTSETTFQMDFDNLNSGIYIVRIVSGEKSKSIRLIKN